MGGERGSGVRIDDVATVVCRVPRRKHLANSFFAECQTDSTRQTIFLNFFVLFFFFCSSKYITMHFENTMSNLLNNMYLICYFYYFIIYAVIA